jgi:O-antigen ligase
MQKGERPAAVAAAALTAVALAALLPALSARFGHPVQFAAAALLALTVVRPAAALMVGIAFVPIAGAITGLIAPAVDGRVFAECLCLAAIAGSCVRGLAGAPIQSRLLWPAVGFGTIATASIVVQYAATGWPPPTMDTATALLQAEGALRPAAALLEILIGLALAVIVSSRDLAADRSRLLLALVAGLTGAGALNLIRFAEAALARADALRAVTELFTFLRVSTEYPDVNAAGSAFVLGLMCAAGLVAAARRGRIPLLVAIDILIGALVLAGSRTAFFAAVVAPAGMLVFAGLGRRRRAVALTLLAGAMLVGTALLVWSPRIQANVDAGTAVSVRGEMLRRGLRMTQDHPFSGIGFSRFFDESVRYATPHSFGPENAHNNFVQLLAELGIPGLAAFFWLLWRGLGSALGAIRAGDRRRFWVAAGVAAYLLTCIGGHPLLVFQAAFPFWVALGLSADSEPGRQRGDALTAAVLAAVMLVSIPFRVHAERRALHLDEPSLGEWLTDGDMRYRRVGAGYAIFVAPGVQGIDVPLQCEPAAACDRAVVEVRVDGTPINSLRIGGRGWTIARLPLPPAEGYADRRVEIRLEQPDGRTLLAGRPTLR